MDAEEIKEQLMGLNPEALFAGGLDSALIGIAWAQGHPVACYDRDRLIACYMAQDMTMEQAGEFLDKNFLCGSYLTENSPIVLDREP